MQIKGASFNYYTRNWKKFMKMYEATADTFLYFAYGSNLLKRRIRINNASAEFIGIGRLESCGGKTYQNYVGKIVHGVLSTHCDMDTGDMAFDSGSSGAKTDIDPEAFISHQLDFIKYSDHWRGTSATIVPLEGAHVWGAIWRLHVYDMPALDKQEGVETNWYFAKTVDIITPDGYKVQCRTYQQTENPPPRKPGEELPMDRRPSITYLDCIINGARECEMPPSYIEKLEKIPHNGQEASPKMIEKLKRTC